MRGTIGFGFASHWLKNWRESFKPITKRSNRNHVITFDRRLKTALFGVVCGLRCYNIGGNINRLFEREAFIHSIGIEGSQWKIKSMLGLCRVYC